MYSIGVLCLLEDVLDSLGAPFITIMYNTYSRTQCRYSRYRYSRTTDYGMVIYDDDDTQSNQSTNVSINQ